ncbi:MAG: hypothetical protein L0241_32335, partial [Planctomycetia bacterium]|nr:hypothetical protein [Planctomycetia bacterium]
GATAAALFITKEANHEAAIAECTKPEAPLLKQVDKIGVITAAGFAKVAVELSEGQAREVYDRLIGETPDEQVGTLAKGMVSRLGLSERVGFIQDVIRRTPSAALELNTLLQETIQAEQAEAEVRITAVARRRAADEATNKALARFQELMKERHANRLDAIRREWEAEGQKASELPQLGGSEPNEQEAKKPLKKPETSEDTNFRRQVARRLVSAWLDAWDANKPDAIEYLRSAIWNMSGFRQLSEVGQSVTFDGRYHEGSTGLFTGDAVHVVRPGWVLEEEEDREYIVQKAQVAK